MLAPLVDDDPGSRYEATVVAVRDRARGAPAVMVAADGGAYEPPDAAWWDDGASTTCSLARI